MTAFSGARLLELPGPRRLLEEVQEDLSFGRSVLLSLPRCLEPELFWSPLETVCWNRSWEVRQVALDDLAPGPTPLQRLARSLGLAPAAGMAAFLKSEGLPTVVRLEGLERLEAQEQSQWLGVVRQWGENLQAWSEAAPPPVVCLLVPAPELRADLPASNVRLAVRVCLEVPSLLDLRVLYRSLAPDSTSAARWLETVLNGIAGPDPALAQRLAARPPGSMAQVEGVLLDHARDEDWTPSDASGAMDALQGGPSSAAVRPWRCRGLLHWTHEHGLEAHSALLALLGRRPELEHRLWREQARLVLPELDILRLGLIRTFTEGLGDDWPTRWEQPQGEHDQARLDAGPWSCQWGYLDHLVQRVDAFSRWRDLRPLLRRLRDVRNSLAHFQPIDAATLDQYYRDRAAVSGALTRP